MSSSTSSSEDRTPKSRHIEEIHISTDHPTSGQEDRHNKQSSTRIVSWKDLSQPQQKAGVDHFTSSHNLNINTTATERKQFASHSFEPYSPSEKNVSSFGSSPTTLQNRPVAMSGFTADAPNGAPANHDLEHRRSSSKSFQQIQREGTLSSIRTHLGLIPEAPIVEGHEVHHHLTWSGIRVIMREPFAEFLGTFIMILFGDGSVAQVLLSGGEAGWGIGNYQSINWCWGIGVMLGVYTAGDSGAFLNPAVMLAFCLFRGFPWKRFPIYFIAQVLGAFFGSGVVYANYINAINNYEGYGKRTVPGYGSAHPTAGIFATYPQAFLSKASQFFSEFIASTILVFVIFALKDESNPGAMGKSGAGKFFPIALLFLIFGIGAAFGWETGYAINLARDFGPRLMSYAVGYGPEVWRAGDWYFWVPMVAPFLGCAFGGFLYDVFIYTGPESPINTPWWGLRDLFNGKRLGGDGRGAVQAQAEAREMARHERTDKDMV